MAKAIAAITRQKLDINQQCLSEGVANVVGSMFHCFPGSGSLTRSTINQQAGGRTQWSGVIAAAAVALTVVSVRAVCLLHSQVGPGRYSDALFLAIGRPPPAHVLPAHDAIRCLDRHPDRRFGGGRFCRVLRVDRRVSVVRALCAPGGTRSAYRADHDARAGRPRTASQTIVPCSRIRIYSLEGEFFFGAAPELEQHLDSIVQAARHRRPSRHLAA